MRKILIVVDMQNDFVTGALKNDEAIGIVPDVVRKIQQERTLGTEIIFTRDSHSDLYMDSEEGHNLPVPHCIKGSQGWEIIDDLKGFTADAIILDKETFGSRELGQYLLSAEQENHIDELELIGICTDICVISNALLAKAFLPNIPITVDSKCCAGVSVKSHNTALEAMKACHIHIL